MKIRPFFLFILFILLLFPFLGDSYLVYIIDLVLIVSIAAVGLDILMGYAGQICFGQAGFIAVGAYATAFLVKNGLFYWFALPMGGLFAASAGLLIGLPALRIRGHYLALATLSFGYIIHLVLIHWESVTGGPRGLIAARPTWPFSFEEDNHFYFIIILISIFMFVVGRNIITSKYGRAFLAIQKDDIIAKSMGINLTRYKTLAFVLSSFYAGIAGGLYGSLIGFLDPLSFTVIDSAYYMMMIIIGGRGTLFGGFIGAAVYIIIPELFRRAEFFQELLFGLVFLCFLLLMPNGVMGFLKKHRSVFVEQIRRVRFLSILFEGKREKGKRLPASVSPFLPKTLTNGFKKGSENGFLEVRDLSISFGGLRALNKVSFEVREGEIFSLIGPNGAGKTTTLNVITRLYEPNEGEVLFRGEKLLKMRSDQIIQKRISRTFQGVGLFTGLSALENVMVGMHPFGRAKFFQSAFKLKKAKEDEAWRRVRAMEMLKLLNLEEQALEVGTDLPFGQQKLVGIARALVSEPHLLILDEPASGLSAMEVEQLMDLIRDLCDKKGSAILLVEHDMQVVMGVSDRIFVLNFGEKIAEGNPEEIRNNPLVVEAYLGQEEGAQGAEH
jgi:ABC-type branched-subunit amino acid transport system ATPase component/ABC-type branched-subunit amino acid transport system permease subunit